MSDHLNVSTSDRGFRALPPIVGDYGGTVRVYESSAAKGPHVWLSITDKVGQSIHLAAEDAWKLSEQLRYLVEHHYQGDARPAGSS